MPNTEEMKMPKTRKFKIDVVLSLSVEADDVPDLDEAIICVTSFLQDLERECANDNPRIENWTIS